MAAKITVDMLDRFRAGHSYEAVSRLRVLLESAGVDVELHPYEIHEIRRLRLEAKGCANKADNIEARGPYPEDYDPDAAPA